MGVVEYSPGFGTGLAGQTCSDMQCCVNSWGPPVFEAMSTLVPVCGPHE